MDDILKESFRELLFNTAKYNGEELLTALFPIQGNLFKSNRDLMVIGRAVNKWGRKEEKMWWRRGELTDAIVNNIINYSKEVEGKCPMKWIVDRKGYRNSSAFWRVTKNILKELQITQSEDDWSSYLVWTDLYKVSRQKGGNPLNSLMNAQYDDCVCFLKKEIKYFEPKRILFLCGYDWFRDFEKIGFIGTRHRTNVEWIGKFGKAKVVVSKHPRGKNESEIVDQVREAFIKL